MLAIVDQIKPIRLLVLDVDGVLTNGLIFCSDNDGYIRAFHVHDGLGIKLLQKTGVQVAVISAKYSEAVAKRLAEIGVLHVYLGREEKLPAYLDLKEKLQYEDHEIAYMGDDLPDLPLLRRVGLAITVPQAPIIVKNYAHYISRKKGGKGAVREVCELIMETQAHLQFVLESYLV